MLFLQYPTITQHYFILCFAGCLGVLQWIAARRRKSTLTLLGQWGLGWPGKAAGFLLVAASFGWFFTCTPGLFSPGLAGGELSILFMAGGLCTLLVVRLASWVWQHLLTRKFHAKPQSCKEKRQVNPKP